MRTCNGSYDGPMLFGVCGIGACHGQGLPIAWALAGAKADEREVFQDMLDRLPPGLAAAVAGDGQATMGDKNYYGRAFEQHLNAGSITMICSCVLESTCGTATFAQSKNNLIKAEPTLAETPTGQKA